MNASRRVLQVVSICLASASPALGQPFPLHLEPVGEIQDVELGRPIAAAVLPDGGLVVADMINNEILRFTVDGHLLWRTGREGAGPGEFRLVYRVAARSDGSVLVYDDGLKEITEFDSEGNYAGRRRLPFPFAQFDQFVALPDDGIAVAGVTSWGQAAAEHAVHVFDRELKYVRSFGPLPDVRDRQILDVWGAGGLTTTGNGDLLYTRRLPYEIYRYSPEGQLKGVLRVPIEISATPDDAIENTVEDGRLRLGYANPSVPKPLPGIDIGSGWVLTGRVVGQELRWDLVDEDGTLVGTQAAPADLVYPAGFDPATGALWVKGRKNLEPTYTRFLVARGGRRP